MNTPKAHPLSLLAALGAFLIALTSNSCTVLAPATAALTNKIPAEKTGWPRGKVKEGQRITVLLSDSAQVAGRYRGTRPLVGEDREVWYEVRFATWAERNRLCLTLGEPVVAYFRTGSRMSGTLAEFDRAGIALVHLGESIRSPLTAVDYIETEGGCVVSRSELQSIAPRDWLHPPERILIEDSDGRLEAIAPDSVRRTTVYPHDQRVKRAFVVGVLSDASTVAAAYLVSLFFYFLLGGL